PYVRMWTFGIGKEAEVLPRAADARRENREVQDHSAGLIGPLFAAGLQELRGIRSDFPRFTTFTGIPPLMHFALL
ncbi:MAG: hypothetical protein CFE26_20165, partial [Verrucomicrobiales bacterium VVV1]